MAWRLAAALLSKVGLMKGRSSSYRHLQDVEIARPFSHDSSKLAHRILRLLQPRLIDRDSPTRSLRNGHLGIAPDQFWSVDALRPRRLFDAELQVRPCVGNRRQHVHG